MGDVTYLNAHRTGDPLQWRQHSLTGGGLGRRWHPAVALVDGARRWAGHLWRPAVPPYGGTRHGVLVCGVALARGHWGAAAATLGAPS